jgi:phasin family protein
MANDETGKAGGAGLDPMRWLEEFRQMAEKYKLPGIDIAALTEWQRKDMEALVEANKQASEGVRALIERRNEILRDAFAEWQAAVKDVASPQAFSKQAEAAKQNVEKAMANFRELTQLEAQARTSAWKVLQDRMQDNLANLQKLLTPK